MNEFFLTTAIDYMNGTPHIGHAYEKIMTDVIARHFKQRGRDVYFLTGSDEHGIKIQKTAAAQNTTPQELCDMNSEKFKECWKLLDVDYDKYIRTTDADHKSSVQKIFKTLLDKGDIYKNSYTGLYCPGCECFLNQRDLTEDGLCPTHRQKPDEITEENYFFRLSNYKDKIIEHIKKNENFIVPSFRVNEILNQLENLEDISVSRSKSSVSWGIEVPGDDSQIIYVWIDALSNYITALGYSPDNASENFKKYWPASVQIVGKDILKFHSIYWPGLLMALGLEPPKSLLVHGWITIDQTKMSKSIGNVIAPKDVFETYELKSADALRYFMMTTAPLGKDGNYSDQDFKEKVNADLANNIGNLLNRTLNMLVKYFDGEIKEDFVTDESNAVATRAVQTLNSVKEKFDAYDTAEAAAIIVQFADFVNKYVNDTAPWSLAKEEKWTECGNVIYNVLESMRIIGFLLQPYCPNIAQDVYSQLGFEENISELKYANIIWGGLKPGFITTKDKISPVFLRLDSEIASDKKKG